MFSFAALFTRDTVVAGSGPPSTTGHWTSRPVWRARQIIDDALPVSPRTLTSVSSSTEHRLNGRLLRVPTGTTNNNRKRKRIYYAVCLNRATIMVVALSHGYGGADPQRDMWLLSFSRGRDCQTSHVSISTVQAIPSGRRVFT